MRAPLPNYSTFNKFRPMDRFPEATTPARCLSCDGAGVWHDARCWVRPPCATIPTTNERIRLPTRCGSQHTNRSTPQCGCQAQAPVPSKGKQQAGVVFSRTQLAGMKRTESRVLGPGSIRKPSDRFRSRCLSAKEPESALQPSYGAPNFWKWLRHKAHVGGRSCGASDA